VGDRHLKFHELRDNLVGVVEDCSWCVEEASLEGAGCAVV
jgi:hypothetical protein